MTRPEEIELLVHGLINDLKETLRKFPTLEIDEIIRVGKELEKYTKEMEQLKSK